MRCGPDVVFLDPGELRDADLILRLSRRAPADASKRLAASYWFELIVEGVAVGTLNLRLDDSPEVEMFDGHLGYTVYPKFRGRRYALRACRLVLPLARAHGLMTLWITCHPENHASRRTCEGLGAVFVEIVHRPRGGDMCVEGEDVKCRYRLEV
ncbi:MAG TPA: GNAT family N-acetyltransferase [Tepidisphaeraceae bacterium]|nr:GNAT family N-acetyltransferase [Tepidisphaeraceae bacterium]